LELTPSQEFLNRSTIHGLHNNLHYCASQATRINLRPTAHIPLRNNSLSNYLTKDIMAKSSQENTSSIE